MAIYLLFVTFVDLSAGHTFTKELLNSVGENVTSDDMPVYTTPLSSCCCDVNLDLTSVCPQANQSFPTRCSANAVPTNIGNILSLSSWSWSWFVSQLGSR